MEEVHGIYSFTTIAETKTSSLSLPFPFYSSWFHVDIRKNVYVLVLLLHRETVLQLLSITAHSSIRLRKLIRR